MSTEDFQENVRKIKEHIDSLKQLFETAGMNVDGSLKKPTVSLLQEDVQFDVCPSSTDAYVPTLFADRGISLKKQVYDRHGRVCLNSEDLATLVESRDKIVNKARTLAASCATLMHKLVSLSQSQIECENINTNQLEGLTTPGKNAICGILKDKNTGNPRCEIKDDNCVPIDGVVGVVNMSFDRLFNTVDEVQSDIPLKRNLFSNNPLSNPSLQTLPATRYLPLKF